jgi:hypothetical protein
MRKAFSYSIAESAPMVANRHTTYHALTQSKCPPENIMDRFVPMTWTSIELALAAAATWLVYESEALSGAALLFLP